jgi:hypothetical protein
MNYFLAEFIFNNRNIYRLVLAADYAEAEEKARQWGIESFEEGFSLKVSRAIS